MFRAPEVPIWIKIDIKSRWNGLYKLIAKNSIYKSSRSNKEIDVTNESFISTSIKTGIHSKKNRYFTEPPKKVS
jgi:hypothetical protein